MKTLYGDLLVWHSGNYPNIPNPSVRCRALIVAILPSGLHPLPSAVAVVLMPEGKLERWPLEDIINVSDAP